LYFDVSGAIQYCDSLIALAADVCFSVITADRTLDLQCANMRQRDVWVHVLRGVWRKEIWTGKAKK
jgi:hypothetical protein